MRSNEKEIFEELNCKLADNNMSLEIICVGGFVLSHNNLRATLDIDGFFKSNSIIDSIIRDVGNKFEINKADELWLNNSVQNLNSPPNKDICDLLYNFSNLKVYIAPLDYVAGMKLISCREQDILDVASIIKAKAITDPIELSNVLFSYGFENIDESVLLEAFGRAYGMKWLESYYIEHEDEILKKF